MTAPNLTEMLTVINAGARTREDILTGPALPTPHGRAFGGQVLGQALAAAAATAPEGREIHSMHGYFLRPGDSNRPMTFGVDRLYDGRSFSTRRTHAYQDGQVLMSCISSYQVVDAGVEHSVTRDMSQLPDPETLPNVWEKYGHLTGSAGASWILDRPFDFRHIGGDITLDVPEKKNSEQVWMRAREPFEHPQLLQSAALAFASDYLLLEPIARAHGYPWATPGVRFASLDHAMWFHRPFRVDEWLLYELESPTAQGGRGLSHGKFFNQRGELVASVSQELMTHFPA